MTDELTTQVQKRPEYLTTEVLEAVDNSDLQTYAKPPRLKIIQALTGAPLKPPYAEGDIVITPQNIKIADEDTPFTFVPIHFFPSWSCLNPLQMRGTLQTIREFSLDPTSEVARKAKAFAKEKCPENPEFSLKYNEALNFMFVIEGVEEFADVPIHMFFVRGEYGTGQKLIGDIQLRKAPRYACRFRACSALHTNKNGQSWKGLAIYNDSTPWVPVEDYHKYEKMHKQVKELIDSRSMELDLEDASEPASEGESEY